MSDVRASSCLRDLAAVALAVAAIEANFRHRGRQIRLDWSDYRRPFGRLMPQGATDGR